MRHGSEQQEQERLEATAPGASPRKRHGSGHRSRERVGQELRRQHSQCHLIDRRFFLSFRRPDGGLSFHHSWLSWPIHVRLCSDCFGVTRASCTNRHEQQQGRKQVQDPTHDFLLLVSHFYRARRPRMPIAMRYNATIRFSSLGMMRINIPAISAASGAKGTYIDNLRPFGVHLQIGAHFLRSEWNFGSLASRGIVCFCPSDHQRGHRQLLRLRRQ
jgi:hypothetical protein